MVPIVPAGADLPALPAGAPVGQSPVAVRAWFDDAADAIIPAFDGTLDTARAAERAYARHAKAANTRRAYRAGAAPGALGATTITFLACRLAASISSPSLPPNAAAA